MSLSETCSSIKAEDHLGLVGKYAKSALQKHSFDVEDYDDIFQIGCIGLIKACSRSNGQNFPSYASKYIKGEISHHLRTLTGRKEYGYSGRKPHYQAISIHAFDSEDSLFFGDESSDESEYHQFIQEVWHSRWEEKPLQRQCIELIIMQGLNQSAAAKSLGFSAMHISRNLRKGLQLLKEAYKKRLQHEGLL